jgi:hypothetical protein
MAFLAIDSFVTAIVAAAIVIAVVLGNEIYFRNYRKRNNLPERPPEP